MKYLKRFAQHADYEAYMGGGVFYLPNVSVCDDDAADTVHYNPTKPWHESGEWTGWLDSGKPTSPGAGGNDIEPIGDVAGRGHVTRIIARASAYKDKTIFEIGQEWHIYCPGVYLDNGEPFDIEINMDNYENYWVEDPTFEGLGYFCLKTNRPYDLTDKTRVGAQNGFYCLKSEQPREGAIYPVPMVLNYEINCYCCPPLSDE